MTPIPKESARDRRPGAGRLAVTAGLGLLVLVASAGAAWLARGRWGGAAAPPTPAPDAPHNADPASRGRLVYQVTCVACHGPEGHGDGPSAAGLKPPPRDFASHDWKFGTDPATVRRVIAQGVPGTAMPASGQSLSPGDVDALTAYVLTLAPPPDDPGTASLRPLLERAGLTPAWPARDAPDMDLLGDAGEASALAPRRGKVVLLAFWETGCVPCLGELPQLERLSEEFGDRGLEVLPVCVNEADAEPVRAVAGRYLKSLPLYRDVHGAARLRYGVDAVPTVCLIDRAGRLLGSGAGPRDWSGPEARELLRACLESPSTK